LYFLSKVKNNFCIFKQKCLDIIPTNALFMLSMLM